MIMMMMMMVNYYLPEEKHDEHILMIVNILMIMANHLIMIVIIIFFFLVSRITIHSPYITTTRTFMIEGENIPDDSNTGKRYLESRLQDDIFIERV